MDTKGSIECKPEKRLISGGEKVDSDMVSYLRTLIWAFHLSWIGGCATDEGPVRAPSGRLESTAEAFSITLDASTILS